MKISIGISNRHVHLKKEDLEVLFGEGYELKPLRPINQPGQFASFEKVTLKTSKDTIENVRILGPVRNYTQIEISRTDAFKLGLNPPVRESGDLKGSAPIIIIGPKGTLELEEGCIIADRHIHITPKEREELGLNNISEVSLKIEGIKGGVLEHVNVRCTETSYYEAHLDTDDANAHFVNNGDIAEIIIKK